MLIARNDGIDRIVARNNNLTAKQIGNTEKHNERKKDSYVNPDIVSERTHLNYHYKSPASINTRSSFMPMHKEPRRRSSTNISKPGLLRSECVLILSSRHIKLDFDVTIEKRNTGARVSAGVLCSADTVRRFS